jgi:hypothetical protein
MSGPLYLVHTGHNNRVNYSGNITTFLKFTDFKYLVIHTVNIPAINTSTKTCA